MVSPQLISTLRKLTTVWELFKVLLNSPLDRELSYTFKVLLNSLVKKSVAKFSAGRRT